MHSVAISYLSYHPLKHVDIGRFKHCHLRNTAHYAHIFEWHMCSAVELCRNSRVRSDYLNIVFGIRSRHEYLVACASCRKRSERMSKRNFSCNTEAARNAHHICFLYSAVHRLIRKFLCKWFCTHCTHKIRIQQNYVFILFGKLHHDLTEAVAHCLFFIFQFFSNFYTHNGLLLSDFLKLCIHLGKRFFKLLGIYVHAVTSGRIFYSAPAVSLNSL